MKKILTITIALLILSCSDNENQIIENENFETINYHFNGTVYTLTLERNEQDEMIPVENKALNEIDNIIDENENIIFHDVDDKNIMLFSSDYELAIYLESVGSPLSIKSTNSKALSPYTSGNLYMYIDSYYNGSLVLWDLPSFSTLECYQTGSMENRLKNFSITSNWIVRQDNGVSNCTINFNNNAFGNNPNDKVSSLTVNNVFARFYEDANYGGRSITRDARTNGSSSFSRLKSVRYRGRWDNRISSVKLSF
ncbi:hypothetical protein [Maribacter sp. R77961]|uniref:hypothetical protein n=1 Tax=Maribacter sp. R77961 TaxID=3093871 RepID=UPI0037CB670E